MREGVGFAAGALVGAVVAAAATYAYISSERKGISLALSQVMRRYIRVTDRVPSTF